MATVEQLYKGLQDQVVSAMAAASLPVGAIGIDWPSSNVIQAVATGASNPVITIFDRGGTKNNTRTVLLSPCLPYDFGTTGSTLVSSEPSFSVAQSITLVGAGVPLVNDAFFFVVADGAGFQFMGEYIATSGDTLIHALTQLTAAINAAEVDGVTGALVATYDGVHTVTVTNNSEGPLTIRAGTVNIGTITQEIYRMLRDIQIVLWCKDPLTRGSYGAVLEQLFAGLELNFGIQLADQSWCRLIIQNDMVWKDLQNQDIYRRDFIIQADYPVLQTLAGWAIEQFGMDVNGITGNT